MYAFKDGICYIYRRAPAETESKLPISEKDESTKRMFYFNDLGISEKEFYDALLAELEIVRRIEILFRSDISAKDIVEIGSESYKVGRVIHVFNKQGIRVTKITLER